MLRLTREMNFAETVFLLPRRSEGDVAIRIFTPGGELPFAGHPVLGTAFVVATAPDANSVTLETGAGLVPIASSETATASRSGACASRSPPGSHSIIRRASAALGVRASGLPIELYRNGPPTSSSHWRTRRRSDGSAPT